VSLPIRDKEAASRENLLLADGRVGEGAEVPAPAAVQKADQVAEQGRIRSLAALVRGDACELEELVDLRLGELEDGDVFTRLRRKPSARLRQPVVHTPSLDLPSP
jgi:hypothetical protein